MQKESADEATRDDAERPAPGYPVSSVDNALRLLLLFRERPSVRLTEACAYLDVAHSTAHRLLAALIHRGFVRQDPQSRAYLPGPMLVEIGLAVVEKMDVRIQARPLMERLAEEFAETIHLVVLEGNQARFVDSVESDRALRVAARTGKLLPAHCTSAGKALLATLSRADVHDLYPDGRLQGQTGQSLRTLRALDAALEEIREQGYATNHEESEDGVGSIAIALFDARDRPVAALAVAVPVGRLNPRVETHIVRALREAQGQFREIAV